MAKNNNNILTRYYGGRIGKQVVLKVLPNGETIATKYPDRTNVILSADQVNCNNNFRDAVAYAQSVIRDPEQKAALAKKLKADKRKRNRTSYNVALQDYLRSHGIKNNRIDTELFARSLQQKYGLNERQYLGIKIRALGEELNCASYRNFHRISKASATRDLQNLVRLGILIPAGNGVATKYNLANPDLQPD